jgi:hypothetical protein
MSTTKLTHLGLLLAVFGTRDRIEHLEEELHIAARHHTELAEHLRDELAAGSYEHPHSLITAPGATHLAAVQDTLAATSIALAATIHTALNPDDDEEDDQ